MITSSTTLDLIGSNQFIFVLKGAVILFKVVPYSLPYLTCTLNRGREPYPGLVLFSAAFTPPLIGIGPPFSGKDGALGCLFGHLPFLLLAGSSVLCLPSLNILGFLSFFPLPQSPADPASLTHKTFRFQHRSAQSLYFLPPHTSPALTCCPTHAFLILVKLLFTELEVYHI